MLTLIAQWQAVTQPTCGTSHDLDIVHTESDFLVQFAVESLFSGFSDIDSTLRKLPPVITQATPPQYIAVLARNNHAYIGAKAIGIYDFGNTFHGAFYPRIHYPAVYDIRASLPARSPARATNQ